MALADVRGTDAVACLTSRGYGNGAFSLNKVVESRPFVGEARAAIEAW
jgi:hypothetical protein